MAIDWNGDGRIDKISSGAAVGGWEVMLNMPDPADPTRIVTQRRMINTEQIFARLAEAGHAITNTQVGRCPG